MKKAEKNSGHSFEDYFKRALNPLVILSILQERPKYAYLFQHCFQKPQPSATQFSISSFSV